MSKYLDRSNSKFRLIAIISEKKKILSIGTNIRKTHPISHKTRYGELHAEMSAIVAAKGFDLSRSTLYVARWKHEGPGMAKPCKYCMEVIKNSGIKKVVYTTNQPHKEDNLEFGIIKIE